VQTNFRKKERPPEETLRRQTNRELVDDIMMPAYYFRFEEEMDAKFYTRKADII